jgi:hypothetical protein
MDRREFLGLAAATAAIALRARPSSATTEPASDAWRTFEITTRVHVLQPSGPTRVWLPMPLAVAPYQKTLGDTYTIPNGTTSMVETADVDILVASWDDGVEPAMTITNRVATTRHTANLKTPTVPPPLDMRPFAPFLRPSRLAPAAGTKEAADRITRGAGTDLERAQAIYAAVVEERSADAGDPALRFAALARASGVPAREVWGLRTSNADATRAQQTRVEVYLTGYGWVPVDVAGQQFGAWDAEWIAYNSAQSVVLPGSTRGAIDRLMHPQAETRAGRRDATSPDTFQYDIAVREAT